MTPEERKLVTDLFDRLAALEDAQRDPEAERAIQDGLRQAPNAVYPLVQTVLVQDEALKQADARIRELESELGIGQEPARQSGFLGNMRDALLGRQEPTRAGSVPSVRPPGAPMGAPPAYRSEAQPMAQAPQSAGPGGSFLGTAAAAAAGAIGGSLLLGGISSMMGPRSAEGMGGTGRAQAATGEGTSPWGDASGSDLARRAGLDDTGRSPAERGNAGEGRGLLDTAANETDASQADQSFEEASLEDLDENTDFDLGGDGDPT